MVNLCENRKQLFGEINGLFNFGILKLKILSFHLAAILADLKGMFQCKGEFWYKGMTIR